MTGVSECSQQRGNLKDDGDDGYKYRYLLLTICKDVHIFIFYI
ncbi:MULTISPECIES: hypothetical protein [Photorhabdus]|nr:MULTISPECIES: hypothetical protein [Photorhabdus]